MARCCPDELNPESWSEDAPYIWEQIVALWGRESVEARVMCARFGFEGVPREPIAQIAERVSLKPYRCSELVQQVLQRIPFVSDDVPVDVLFEDEHLLVVAKPPHTSVTPRNRSRGGAMLNRAAHHLRPPACASGGDGGDGGGGPAVFVPAPSALAPRRAASAAIVAEPFVVHRLDFNTSGVLLFAKTSAAANRLSEQFREPGRVRKAYLALCAVGPAAPAAGEWVHVDAPLGREDRSRQMVRADGKSASTRLRRVACGGEASHGGGRIGGSGGGSGTDGIALVVARPLTGRTHQIRVHAAHAGLPLLGDDVYGVESALLDRHALHAWRISFDHPATGERVRIDAPLPADLAAAARALGLALPADVLLDALARFDDLDGA